MSGRQPSASTLVLARGLLLVLLLLASGLGGYVAAAQPSPTPTRSPAAGNATASPTAEGSRVCDPNATCGPRAYEFVLRNESLDQNLTVRGADRVELVSTRVFGDLVLEGARRVVLRDLFVSGAVRIEDSRNVSVERLLVARDVRLRAVGPLEVHHVNAGGAFSCEVCADGAISEVLAGGAVSFQDVWGVERTNVRSAPVQLSSPPAPSPNVRQVRLEVAPSNLSFAHERAVDASDGPRGLIEVRLDVDPAAASARLVVRNDTRPAVEPPVLDSRFEKLLEFEDVNGDGAFDLGDRVLRELRVADLRPRAVQQQRLSKELEGWQSRLEFDVGAGGTFALVFTTRDAAGDQTKVDLEFEDYPYATPRSRLALQVRLDGASSWRFEPGGQEDRIRFPGQDVDTYFSWVRQALADGVNSTVRVRFMDDRGELGDASQVVLLMSYDRARQLRHDPTIGVAASSLATDALGPLGDRVVYGAALGSTLVVLWAMGRAARRAKP